MFEAVYKLKTGLPVAAAKGLDDLMCVRVKNKTNSKHLGLILNEVEGIKEEVYRFASLSDDEEVKQVKELLDYILTQPSSEQTYANGIRDKGRKSVLLADFLEDPKFSEAGLFPAELVAMRLYTTVAYKFMNNPLRDGERYNKRVMCQLPVTTHVASSGIKKLRALCVDVGEKTLWRGMRNTDVADDFMNQGGTELAFMSTTSELSVAVRYCLSKNSLLFKIVSSGFMTMGADVQWLSAFPSEAEILYPPLTYLKPTGRKQIVPVERKGERFLFTVVEVHPQLG